MTTTIIGTRRASARPIMISTIISVALGLLYPATSDAPAEGRRLCWVAVYAAVAPAHVVAIGEGADAYLVASDEDPLGELVGRAICE